VKKSVIFTGTIVTSLLAGQNALASHYTVQEGDTLWDVSKNYKTTVKALKQTNHLASNLIVPGQVLKVGKNNNKWYIVKKGDTLSGIAQRFHTTVRRLLQLNPDISDPDWIRAGDTIQMPESDQGSAPPVAERYYIAKEHDTLSGIAARFHTTVRSLLALNPGIANPHFIRAGQAIKVAGSPHETSPSKKRASEPLKTVRLPKQQVSASYAESRNEASASSLADRLIQIGERYLGATYVYGASPSRTDAFDCSSFTMRVFGEAGISLPRTSAEQSKMGADVSLNELQKGDLVFFDTDLNGIINHVGIYAGNGQLLNATISKGVCYVSLDSSYWKNRFVKATRLIRE
jgi:peptidoglycan endopeptidase LytE